MLLLQIVITCCGECSVMAVCSCPHVKPHQLLLPISMVIKNGFLLKFLFKESLRREKPLFTVQQIDLQKSERHRSACVSGCRALLLCCSASLPWDILAGMVPGTALGAGSLCLFKASVLNFLKPNFRANTLRTLGLSSG